MSAKIILANATYEEEKARARSEGQPHRITLRVIERRCGLKAAQLFNWRANDARRAKNGA